MKNLNFKLSEAPVFEDNPEFLSIEEFARLTERQMRYVMLVDWYGSPLRLMKPEDRRYRAAVMAGYKLEKDGKRLDMNGRNLIDGKVQSVEAARKVLTSIQYDAERDLLSAIDNQIRQIVDFLNKPEKNVQEIDKATQMLNKLPSILENRKKIVEILNFRDQIIVDTSGNDEKLEQKTSLLDEYTETLE
jgi:hypothetical protein